MKAVEEGNLAAVQTALTDGANVNTWDNTRGNTVLITASVLGETDIVKLLLDKGADISINEVDLFVGSNLEILELLRDNYKNATNLFEAFLYKPMCWKTPFPNPEGTIGIQYVDSVLAAGKKEIPDSHRSEFKMKAGEPPFYVLPSSVERALIAFPSGLCVTMKKHVLSEEIIHKVLYKSQPRFWKALTSFDRYFPSAIVTMNKPTLKSRNVIESLLDSIDLTQHTVILFEVSIPRNELYGEEEEEKRLQNYYEMMGCQMDEDQAKMPMRALAGFCYRDQQPRVIFALPDSIIATSCESSEPTLITGIDKIAEKQSSM